jgi:hypothetical protein
MPQIRKREELGYNVRVRKGGCPEEVFSHDYGLRASSKFCRIF